MNSLDYSSVHAPDPADLHAHPDALACGVVVIGRNEGERLKRCLKSVRDAGATAIVYVDSGSTDGSAQWALGFGVEVVQLDMSVPFTAARARNAGFSVLKQMAQPLRYVQFVDGDCEVAAGWLSTGTAFMDQAADVVCVCGRLRERHPDRSIYNRLADMEWNHAAGESDSCGGIAMMRADAFQSVGGFREGLIAGEEPELCLRMRARGGKIWRLADEMAWHDAAMTRFGQWWRRAMRGGHALAEGIALHGARSSMRDKARLRRVMAWGLALPLAIVILGGAVHPAWIALSIVYPLRAVRLAMKSDAEWPRNALWSIFMVLSSFPEVIGVFRYWLNRARGRHAGLIEYK